MIAVLTLLGCTSTTASSSGDPATASGSTAATSDGSTPLGSGPTTTAPPVTTDPSSTTSTVVETIGPKACGLLTGAQVAPVLGFDPVVTAGSTPSFLGGGYSSVCDFRHESDPGRLGRTVRVFVFPPGTALAKTRRALDEPHDVNGLGAVAIAGRAPEDSGSGPNTILVDAGTQGFSVTVVTGTEHTDADLVALARPALANFMAAGPASATPRR